MKEKIIAANGLDMRLFRTLPDYYRSLPGKLADKLVALDKAGASKEELVKVMGGLRGLRLGMLEGNTDEGYISLGTGIGSIRSVKSVAEIVAELHVNVWRAESNVFDSARGFTVPPSDTPQSPSLSAIDVPDPFPFSDATSATPLCSGF